VRNAYFLVTFLELFFSRPRPSTLHHLYINASNILSKKSSKIFRIVVVVVVVVAVAAAAMVVVVLLTCVDNYYKHKACILSAFSCGNVELQLKPSPDHTGHTGKSDQSPVFPERSMVDP